MKNNQGFSLMELLIAITIIGILAAIAIPNYTEYVRRGNRADARGQLLVAAQWMERFRAENNTYVGATLPAALTRSPVTGTALYGIALSNLTATTYTLTATPASTMATDTCGSFTLDQAGARTANGLSTGANYDYCWGR